MTTSRQSWRKKKVELLVHGYIFKNYEYLLPIEIINICQLFYDKHFYWIIKGKDMIKFKNNTQKDQCILTSKIFTYNQFKFKFKLYPRGFIGKYHRYHDRNILMIIELINFPPDICCFDLSVEINFENLKNCGCIYNSTLRSDGRRPRKYTVIRCRFLEYEECKSFNELRFNWKISIVRIRKISERDSMLQMLRNKFNTNRRLIVF